MPAIKQDIKCIHCGEFCESHKITSPDGDFCCLGCKSIYEILNHSNLCEYYNLNQNPGIKIKSPIKSDKFKYLDKPSINDKLIKFKDVHVSHISLYLPQIHCSSCLWLLERLSQVNPNIISSRIQLYEKEIYIVYNHNELSLSQLVTLLASIGYEPSITLDNISKDQSQAENNYYGLRIGIAGFCFGNIMLMSLADYFAQGTMEQRIHQFISYTSLIISLPTLLYSALVFYQSAWSGLKNKIINIDSPIVLAIFITFGRSVYEIFNHSGIGYLDSMSGIIFFMLVSRWFQSRAYKKLYFNKDFKSFFPIYAKRIIENQIEDIELSNIHIQDRILIQSHEIIPVDGTLSKGKAFIDYSFVTGESRLIPVKIGDPIYAGGRQEGSNIEVIVSKEFSKGRLVSLWNNASFKNEVTSEADYYDKIANKFTLVVLLLGFSAGAYWFFNHDISKMWNAIITVLIVACPCALLLAKNFSNGHILKILSNHGFFLRNSEVIKNFNKANTIVFDKTGTLTDTDHTKVHYTGSSLSIEQKLIISSILKQSSHPLCREVILFLNINESILIEHYKETTGKGIEAWVNEKHVKLGSSDFINFPYKEDQETSIYLSIDGKYFGRFIIQNSYKAGLKEMFLKLKKFYNLILLSGDNSGEMKNITQLMGHDSVIKFNQNPQDKLNEITKLQENQAQVIMIGDGLNDAGAFKQSNIGICLSNGKNGFTPACDAILESKHFTKLPQLIAFLQKEKTIIVSVFSFSVIYNIIGLYFSLQGILSPVIAAILMPLSSITILFLSYSLAQYFAYQSQLKNSK